MRRNREAHSNIARAYGSLHPAIKDVSPLITLAERTVTAGKVPEAVIDAARSFHNESWPLNLQLAPATRRGHLMGTRLRGARALWTEEASTAIKASPRRRVDRAVMAGRASLA
jgi:hypothetical protein